MRLHHPVATAQRRARVHVHVAWFVYRWRSRPAQPKPAKTAEQVTSVRSVNERTGGGMNDISSSSLHSGNVMFSVTARVCERQKEKYDPRRTKTSFHLLAHNIWQWRLSIQVLRFDPWPLAARIFHFIICENES